MIIQIFIWIEACSQVGVFEPAGRTDAQVLVQFMNGVLESPLLLGVILEEIYVSLSKLNPIELNSILSAYILICVFVFVFAFIYIYIYHVFTNLASWLRLKFAPCSLFKLRIIICPFLPTSSSSFTSLYF